MRYIADHDLHIHSGISLCSRDKEQNPANILKYGKENGLTTLCLTDHYWDEAVASELNDFYKRQDTAYVEQTLPLPQGEKTRFLFGVEIDLDKHCKVGISKEKLDRFAFIIIPTTHLHMNGFTVRGDESTEERTKLWIDRFDAVLDMDLRFEKVGIAHLTCSLMHTGHHLEVLAAIPEEEYRRLFTKAAKVGVGIELNFDSLALTDEDRELTLRPYRIAKECGCKFYFGSDAHHLKAFEVSKKNFENIIDLLGLEESDKFVLK